MATITPGLYWMSSIQLQARQRAGMVNNFYVTSAEWAQNIVKSYNHLYGLLVSAFREKYFYRTYQFQTVSGQDTYTLPLDVYKVFGIDWVATPGSNLQNVTLTPFEFNRRNQWNLPIGSINGPGCAFYNIQSLNPVTIWLKPFPIGSQVFQLYDCPLVQDPVDAPTITLTNVVATNAVAIGPLLNTSISFVAVNSGASGTQFNVGATDSQTALNLAAAINSTADFNSQGIVASAVGNVVTLNLNGPVTIYAWSTNATTIAMTPNPNLVPTPFTNTLALMNGYDEYLILDSAIKALEKQEKDTSVLMGERARCEHRIEVESKHRDAGQVFRIGGARGWRGSGGFGGGSRPGW